MGRDRRTDSIFYRPRSIYATEPQGDAQRAACVRRENARFHFFILFLAGAGRCGSWREDILCNQSRSRTVTAYNPNVRTSALEEY